MPSQGEDLPDRDPIAPLVGVNRGLPLADCLRGHPQHGLRPHQRHLVQVDVVQPVGLAKVGDLCNVAAVNEDVPGGKVAVDDGRSVAGQKVHAHGYLSGHKITQLINIYINIIMI